MIINLYSIKDRYNGFAAPIIMPNHESAKRWFRDMSESNPTIGNNPEDFTLHFIGKLDTETGFIENTAKICHETCLTLNDDTGESEEEECL